MAIKVQANVTEAHYQNAIRGQQHAIARALDNTLWVAYGHWDNPDGAILVAYSSDGGATWTEEVVTTTNDFYIWDGISIVISSDNIPHIIYSWSDPGGAGPWEIRYVNRAGGVWGTPETVINIGGVGTWNLKAVIDSTDTIHILYERGELRYIFGSSGAWSPFEVPNATGTRGDIALNNSDEPVVVFVGWVPDGVHITYRTGGVWTAIDSVDLDPIFAVRPVPIIQIDANDDYHVAWHNEELLAPWDYYVYYRKKETGVWLARQNIDNDVDDWHVGLGLDDENNAYVIFQLDMGGADEAVYYRKVTNGIALGPEIVIDAGIMRPNGESSVFAFLSHKYPISGVLDASFQPVVVLLDETPIGVNADLYFYAGDYISPFVILPTIQTNQATGVT